jgi:DnaJ-class molecular chaperone
VLGFPGGTVKPSKREVMSRFRASMRDAHPDHGGNEKLASKVMMDIAEARRILLDAL